MRLIDMMPSFAGEQIYPAGFPISSDKIKINGVSVQDIFIRKGNGTDDLKEDEEICRLYMLYFFLAPCFQIEDEDRNKAESLSFDDLFDLCLDNGIDPF